MNVFDKELQLLMINSKESKHYMMVNSSHLYMGDIVLDNSPERVSLRMKGGTFENR